MSRAIICLALFAASTMGAGKSWAHSEQPAAIVHDAEYYVLYEQHAQKWAAQDEQLDTVLAELKKQYGQPPNIVYILWDDTAFGDVGMPVINKVRGFTTPNFNRMAAEGILFTRMYTEPSCTPTRAAALTGRYAVRSGMHTVGFPLENGGLRASEVTVAEVLSQAGYATAFFGKSHQGDVEESYMHNQGFDEALFTPYNQVLSLWNAQGEGANAILGLMQGRLIKDQYDLDGRFLPNGWVMTIEGRKGEPGREWGTTSHEDFLKIDPECEDRTLDFIRRSAESDKPFFVAYWPNLTSFIPNPEKKTVARGSLAEGLVKLDAFIGQLMDELKRLGIAENTLLVAMADNGPMVHNPPPGTGFSDTVFRGGKSDYWEGGIRVPAFAWWPGVIAPGQIVGDMIHVTDLYTTFARLGGATQYIPTDRIIDGVDQTALLLSGDTYGRRDYNFVYKVPSWQPRSRGVSSASGSATVPGWSAARSTISISTPASSSPCSFRCCIPARPSIGCGHATSYGKKNTPTARWRAACPSPVWPTRGPRRKPWPNRTSI